MDFVSMIGFPDLDTNFPVLILKAGRHVIHHGAVGVARTLGRLGVPVYAVVEDCCTPVALSRYVTKAFVWEPWPKDHDAFLNAVLKIGEIIRRPTILVPIDDLSAILIAENADLLKRLFIFPTLPGTVPRQLATKTDLLILCNCIGIPHARSISPRSINDVLEFCETATFPMMMKAAEQWILLDNGYSTNLVRDRDSLLTLYRNAKRNNQSRVVLQEYIPGDDWIYHGYCNSNEGLFVSFTGKKIVSYPLNAGSTAVGVPIRNEALRLLAEKLLGCVSYSGIIDIDWRQDERDGQYKIVDCNPRVGQNFRMFENVTAVDVVRAQHLNLTGRSIECSEMIEKRRFIVESFYLLSIIKNGFRMEMTAQGSLPESGEFAWWNKDDPLPFITMSVRLIFNIAKRVLYRLRRNLRSRI
jgi:D-aspartate ligase